MRGCIISSMPSVEITRQRVNHLRSRLCMWMFAPISSVYTRESCSADHPTSCRDLRFLFFGCRCAKNRDLSLVSIHFFLSLFQVGLVRLRQLKKNTTGKELTYIQPPFSAMPINCRQLVFLPVWLASREKRKKKEPQTVYYMQQTEETWKIRKHFFIGNVTTFTVRA